MHARLHLHELRAEPLAASFGSEMLGRESASAAASAYHLSLIAMTNRIAELNDAFRSAFVGGEVYLTRGIASLPTSGQEAIIERVRAFDDFSAENDPHGEHDFGSFEFSGDKIFWKIDCYDRDLKFGSPNPADPSLTRRVLTILLAEEW
jgi:hypothetical protein